MTPVLKLVGLMPRRIYLPLECKRGDKARPLFEKVRDRRAVALFWQQPGAESPPRWLRAECKFPPSPHPLVSNPLPAELWQRGLQPVGGPGPGEAAPPAGAGLELRLVIRDTREAGLLLTWNPTAFPAGATDSAGAERHRTLTVGTGAEKADAADVGGLRLQIPLLVLKEASPDGSPAVNEEDPAPGRFFGSFRRWLFDYEWHFEPRPIRLQAEKPEPSPEARNMAVLCLDFGTCATAASYVEQVASHADRPDLQPVRELRPWSHLTVLPEFAQQRALGSAEIGQTFHYFNGDAHPAGDGLPLIRDCVPETVLEYRQGIPDGDARRTTVPSLLYALPADAERVLPEEPDAIGIEVEALMAADRTKQRVETRQFLYAPKLTVSQKADQYAAFADIRKGRSPVELFLREYLNQLHQRLLGLELPALPVERVCYSYPVAWVKHQRDALRAHIEQAVQQSYFSERMIPVAQRKVNPYHPGFSMDEASASFLGFIQYRVGGLEGDDLVRAYQPFDPDRERARKYPKRMHVLVFDSGGGTTDVALLEIIDKGDAAHSSVQSYVRRYFALTKAGLEVTRRVAEHLKDLILDKHPGLREALRTNLLEDRLEERVSALGLKATGGTAMSEATARRRRTVAFYDEAERLKIKLCDADPKAHPGQDSSEPIQWAANRSMLDGLNVSPASLPDRLSLQTLRELIGEVYRPVAEQISRWFDDRHDRIDLLLMTGRSSELPGLRDILERAIPERLRPYGFDWITRQNLFLHAPPPGVNPDEATKTLVQEGLRLLYRNRTNTVTKAVNCNPIDETRRDRAIGVMPQDLKTGRHEPAFLPSADLLVEADGAAIAGEKDLVFEETNPTSKGFFLGINYSGRNDRKDSSSDPPLPFMRVRITGGESDSYKRLRFCFHQRSATDIYLHRLELFTDADGRKEPQKTPVESKESGSEQVVTLSLEGGTRLEIRVQPYSSAEDFRLTGRIHLKKPAIDDVEA